MTINLPTAYKGHYPFRLACPSFIYPAGYVDNVRRLSACVDEIELLLLESAPESLPADTEIKELSALAADNNITFNIHLPTDIFPGDDDPGVRNNAVDALLRAIDRSRPLAPVSYTLHAPLAGLSTAPENGSGWQLRVRESIKRLLSESGLAAQAIAIETLNYPLDYLDAVIRGLGLSVCLDTGHLMTREESCQNLYQRYRQHVSIVHVHGVDHGRDHLPLNRLTKDQAREIGHILKDFSQSVSLEVFSVAALADSLDSLDRIWRNLP